MEEYTEERNILVELVVYRREQAEYKPVLEGYKQVVCILEPEEYRWRLEDYILAACTLARLV